jgi:hypothetical protein
MMISKPLAVGLLAAACVTAAAGGAYVAVRQNTSAPETVSAAPAAQPSQEAAPTPVAETEAVVSPATAPTPTVPAASEPAAAPAPVERPRPAPAKTSPPARTAASRPAPRAPERTPAAPVAPPAPAPVPDTPVVTAPPVEPARPEPPPAPPVPQFEELVVPASSVVGLHVESSISSERARVEDRVEARVTRDVLADGRVAIPAGSRAIGTVTAVERGGKIKERARLGIRFHTLVLADGTELPIRTESILREGESPAGESSRKIGGAAIGGAVLGAIFGGGKGAAIGSAVGAGAGTAATMAGDRNAATLPAGTVVTVRLTAPVTLQVEKQ